jgi:hypothetical protein
MQPELAEHRHLVHHPDLPAYRLSSSWITHHSKSHLVQVTGNQSVSDSHLVLCRMHPLVCRYLYQDAYEVLRYVWTTWPHWNRTAGARHLLLSTSRGWLLRHPQLQLSLTASMLTS